MYSLDIREEKKKYVCICATRTSMIEQHSGAGKRKREERTEEGDYVEKKSSSFVCHSFYYDTVVI